MKIAYILPVNMKGYGYTKDNFIKTHFSVALAREAAKEKNEVSLHIFWDQKDIYSEGNLTIYFYPISLEKICNSSFSEISLDLLQVKFSKDTIIHFHEPNRLFYFLFSLGKKNKMIVEHHGTGITNPFPFPSRFSIPFEILKQFFLSKYLQKTSYIIVHNKIARDNFLTYKVDPKKIIIAPNGIQTHQYTIFNKTKAKKELGLQNKTVLLFVGRIHKGKGILELIAGYEKLKVAHPDLELVLLGPLHDTSLQSIVKSYWRGFKNPDALQVWLSAADIFCLPSYSEPFGIVLLEALYYNLPIVTTDIAGPKEFVPVANALFVPPQDAIALQNAITKMLDSNFRKKKSQGGKELVIRYYTWSHICRTYLALYK